MKFQKIGLFYIKENVLRGICIKNCGRWSEIVAVILPEIMSFEITLLKILSIRVLELLACPLGWIIYGK